MRQPFKPQTPLSSKPVMPIQPSPCEEQKRPCRPSGLCGTATDGVASVAITQERRLDATACASDAVLRRVGGTRSAGCTSGKRRVTCRVLSHFYRVGSTDEIMQTPRVTILLCIALRGASQAAAATMARPYTKAAPHPLLINLLAITLLNMTSLVFTSVLPLTAPHAKAMYRKPIIMPTPDWNQKQAANNWCTCVEASAQDRPSRFPPPRPPLSSPLLPPSPPPFSSPLQDVEQSSERLQQPREPQPLQPQRPNMEGILSRHPKCCVKRSKLYKALVSNARLFHLC
jgi:hypothetical protein